MAGALRLRDGCEYFHFLAPRSLFLRRHSLKIQPGPPARQRRPIQALAGRHARCGFEAESSVRPKACRGPVLGSGHEKVSIFEALLVGATGFEPATSSSRTKRATKLRHAPTGGEVLRLLSHVAKKEGSWMSRSPVARGFVYYARQSAISAPGPVVPRPMNVGAVRVGSHQAVDQGVAGMEIGVGWTGLGIAVACGLLLMASLASVLGGDPLRGAGFWRVCLESRCCLRASYFETRPTRAFQLRVDPSTTPAASAK